MAELVGIIRSQEAFKKMMISSFFFGGVGGWEGFELDARLCVLSCAAE